MIGSVSAVALLSACSSEGDAQTENASGGTQTVEAQGVALEHCTPADIKKVPDNMVPLYYWEGDSDKRLARCVPGRKGMGDASGLFTPGGVGFKEKLTGTDNSKATFEILDFDIAAGDGDPFGIVLAVVRTPSSGTEPARNKTVLATMNLDEYVLDKVYDLSEDITNMASGSGNYVALQHTPSDKAPFVTGADLSTGKETWKVDGTMVEARASVYGSFNGSVTIEQEWRDFLDTCSSIGRYSLEDGKPVWEVKPGTSGLLSSLSDQMCWTLVPDSVGPSFTRIKAYANGSDIRGTFYLSNDTGRPAELRETIYEFRDPKSNLSVLFDSGRATSSPGPLLQVVNRDDMSIVYEMPSEQVGDLKMEVLSLYDKKVYFETSDETVTLDATTGEDVETGWSDYPVTYLNGWTVMKSGKTQK